FDARHGTSDTSKISNIADGVLTHDAVNVGQLQVVASAASTAQSAADGAKTAADQAQSTANGAQESADRALTAADRAGAQLAGLGADETVLGRIEDAGRATASALGGGATLTPDGNMTAPDYRIAAIDSEGRVADTPGSHNNVGTAVAALDTNIGTVNDRVSDLASAQANAVSYETAPGGGRTNAVTLLGGDPSAPVLLKNVADGIDAQDSVNLRQLNQARQDIAAQNADYAHQSKVYADQADRAILDQGMAYTDEIGTQVLTSSLNYTDKKFSQVSQDMGALSNKLDQGLGQLSSDIRDVRGEARRAAAIGLAAASLKFDDRPGKLSLAFGGGVWRGHGAAAFGLGYTNENSNVRANLTATSSGGHLGMGGGISFTLN
ncbi:YadA-like family protein, partial [Brucella pseudogrignonensis]